MFRKFLSFAAVSGVGWLSDMGLTVLLVWLYLSPFIASMIGSAVAVTFVYVVSLRAIFGIWGSLGARAFPLYVVWQVLNITVASALVAMLAHWLAPSVAGLLQQQYGQSQGQDTLSVASGFAKSFITPLTLLANFLFFQWLTGWIEARQRP